MAKKARAKKLTKPEGQPEEKKSRAKKLLEPKPEEKKTRAKKLPKPEPQPEEAPKAKRGPALPDTEKRQLDRAICEMLVQKNLSDEAIAEAMLSNYGDKGIFTTVQRVEYLRDKVNNNGWYARIVQAAGAELPLEQI